MPRFTFQLSPALSALEFTPQEKSAAPPSVDGLTDARGAASGHAMGPRQILAMVDRLYNEAVFADAVAAYVPREHERVFVEGRDEVYVVIYVDRDTTTADLVSTERVGDLLESVPFTAIYPVE